MAMKCVAQMPEPVVMPSRDEPVDAGDAPGRTRAPEQLDRDQARQKADDPRNDDESQIVFGGEAGQDAIHSCLFG
jgi:hypothetical protein